MTEKVHPFKQKLLQNKLYQNVFDRDKLHSNHQSGPEFVTNYLIEKTIATEKQGDVPTTIDSGHILLDYTPTFYQEARFFDENAIDFEGSVSVSFTDILSKKRDKPIYTFTLPVRSQMNRRWLTGTTKVGNKVIPGLSFCIDDASLPASTALNRLPNYRKGAQRFDWPRQDTKLKRQRDKRNDLKNPLSWATDTKPDEHYQTILDLKASITQSGKYDLAIFDVKETWTMIAGLRTYTFDHVFTMVVTVFSDQYMKDHGLAEDTPRACFVNHFHNEKYSPGIQSSNGMLGEDIVRIQECEANIVLTNKVVDFDPHRNTTRTEWRYSFSNPQFNGRDYPLNARLDLDTTANGLRNVPLNYWQANPLFLYEIEWFLGQSRRM